MFRNPSQHQGPITEAYGDWIELGSNKQTFQDATSPLGVPEQYLDLIYGQHYKRSPTNRNWKMN